MYQRVIAGDFGQSSLSGRLINYDVDSLLVRVDGTYPSGVTDADLHDVRFSAILRGDQKTHFLLKDFSLLDLFKMSDYRGGFSLAADGGTKRSAVLPLGNVILRGHDTIELSIENQSATLTNALSCEVYAIDSVEGDEVLLAYESIEGGYEQVFSSTLAVFATQDLAGKGNVAIKDFEDSYTVPGPVVLALANAKGQMEHWEDIGIVWKDPYNLGQEVSVDLPTAGYVIARRIYDAERWRERRQASSKRGRDVIEQVASANSEAAAILRARGMA